VRHSPRPPPKPAMADDTSVLTDLSQGKPLEGQSHYRADFAPFPAESLNMYSDAAARAAMFKSNIVNHAAEANPTSTYASHYPWKYERQLPPAGSDDASVLTVAVKGQPCTTRSSYKDHFAQPTPRPEPVLASPRKGRNASTLTEFATRQPWEVQGTSYSSHYAPHPLSGRQPSARPEHKFLPQQAFAGSSEYSRQYTQGRQPLVHLEHEDGGMQ